MAGLWTEVCLAQTAIAALAVQVDNGTHDSTSVEMHRADL